ncbi:MAG: hypothetical protein GY832_45110, partial [Chloroflexi bacterium]|nr:hypothetical protein [Chloroflexota bacterium]
DKGALGDVDNLEPRDILAEIQNDGTYADRDAVLESVRREWIDKKPTRTPDEQAEAERLDGSLQDFADLMDHLGLSLDMADETIMARINEAMAKEGGVFNQPVNASVDPTRMVNVVDLSNLPFTVKTNADLRNELHVWANEEIRTADQDRIAKILPKHVRHIAFSSVRPKRRDKKTRQRAVENIIDLLFEAPLIESAPNKKRATKSKVNSYHRFYVPIRDGNNIRVARIVAEQTDKGIALNPDQFDVYDLVLEDEKAPRRLSATNQGSPSSLVARGPMQVSIQDMLTGVKGMDKKSYFQGPRGSFNPQTFTINLFQSANLSTFLHESGHGFLEIMRTLALDENAPDQLRQDWQTILDFMGIDEMPESLTDATPYHEKFARAFEGYLMEGKAPSAELRPIFRRFKDWLVDAYKDLRGLSRDAGHKVEVTPEIAAVFDRMLATDEEIAKAVSDTGWRPAFRNAKEAGLSDAEYDKWAAAYEEAEQVAREKMLSRILKDLKREKKAWWKAELADVRKDVEIKINNSPVYNVINFLRRGETLNGAEIGKPFKLDVDQLMEYGPEVVKMLPGGKYGLHKKGGKNPDIAAGIFGFRSGEEMVDQIIAASIVTQSGKTRFLTPAQAIDRRADEIMKERHGHVLDENRLRNEAAEAMHNVDAAELLTMELNVLRKKRTQDIHDKAARREAAEQGGNFDTRQENADEAVGTLQSDGYGRSEAAFETGANKARKEAGVNQRRAERAAVREARATDVPLAVLREAAIREVSHFSVAELNRLSKFHVAEIRASKAAELALAKRDIDNALLHKRAQVWNHLLYTEGLKAQKKADSITRRLKKAARRKTSSALNVDYHKKMRAVLTAHGFPASLDMAAARQTVLDLADWVEVQNNDGAQIVLADAALSTMDYKAMSFWQFQDLDNAIKNLAKNGRERSDKAREDFRRKMEALGTHIYENNNVRKPRSIEETKLGVAARGIAKFTSAHRKAEFLLRELDGFADLGPVWDAIYKPINDAANKAETLREDAVLKMKDLFKLYHKDGILNRKRFIREIGDSLSKEAVIAVALNMGNADNLDRVQSGFGWDDSQLNAVLSRLDDRDWDFVQATWDYIDSFWPEISGLEERMTGVAPLKVDATPFVTPSGRELRGGYYPIKYDPSATPEAGRDSVDDIYKELISGGWARAATRHGHTKARVGGGGNRQVLLSLEVIPQHIEQVIQDIAYREAINHVDKVIKSRPVQDAIVATKGQPAYEELTPWVKDIATNDVAVDPVWWAKVAKHLRVGLSVAEMGFSLRTALVQPLGLTQTMARLGEGKTLKAFGKYLFSGAHLSQATKFAKEKSVFMRNRSKLFDREVADQVRKLKMGPLSDAKVLYFSLIAKTDEMVAVPTWMAGYDEGMGRWGDEAKAIDYADSVVRMTQSSGHVKDLARIQRGSEGHKLFTAFYSFFSAFHNMGVDTLKQTGQKHSIAGKAFHLTRQATWLVLVPVIANEIFLNGLLAGEEDDEEKMNKLVKAIGTFAGSGMVGVRDAANFFGTDYGYSFSPLARTAETILQASAAVGEAVFDPEEFSRSDARNLLMAFGYAGHLPTRQAWRTLDYLYQYSEGNIDEFSLHSALVTGYKKH